MNFIETSDTLSFVTLNEKVKSLPNTLIVGQANQKKATEIMNAIVLNYINECDETIDEFIGKCKKTGNVVVDKNMKTEWVFICDDFVYYGV